MTWPRGARRRSFAKWLQVTSIAVRVLGPADVTASFVLPPVLELASVAATFEVAPAKLVLPPVFRIAATLIVDRLVVLLLSSVRFLPQTDHKPKTPSKASFGSQPSSVKAGRWRPCDPERSLSQLPTRMPWAAKSCATCALPPQDKH